ncbi:DUF922 domain-containing protein [Panacibacter sp. DH6]|uniref:DUF922 domain-containing protein n=1 Tax=Panacibacter microcysteis TaxID=2793269 RepID=A0A931GZP1_9BACT|nr:hypothetical protein [Panacibacter microcysteis]MBG9378258.1 DUF922 domain-containing protein [Panacibacter microcysteis]
MKTFCLPVLLVMFSIPVKSFSQDTINWRPGYKLSWKDFKAKPDMQSSYAAITDCTVTYSFGYSNNLLNYQVFSFFNKNKSWSKSTNDTALLLHEQGHFDINEIFTRKLKKAFNAYKLNEATVSEDLRAIFNKIWQEKIAFDMLYDQETDHSKNKTQQAGWNKKIADELSRLSAFE